MRDSNLVDFPQFEIKAGTQAQLDIYSKETQGEKNEMMALQKKKCKGALKKSSPHE